MTSERPFDPARKMAMPKAPPLTEVVEQLASELLPDTMYKGTVTAHRNDEVGEPANFEIRTTSSTGAQKGVKAERYDLIPIPALSKLARLYGKGAEKYAAHNWRKGYEWSKSYAAAMRHMTLFWSGEDIDEEMGLPHVICAAFHMFALATYLEEHPEFDDRFETRENND